MLAIMLAVMREIAHARSADDMSRETGLAVRGAEGGPRGAWLSTEPRALP